MVIISFAQLCITLHVSFLLLFYLCSTVKHLQLQEHFNIFMWQLILGMFKINFNIHGGLTKNNCISPKESLFTCSSAVRVTVQQPDNTKPLFHPSSCNDYKNSSLMITCDKNLWLVTQVMCGGGLTVVERLV